MLFHRRPGAVARLRGNGVRGLVRFYPAGKGVLIQAEFSGLPENESGFFALHIHSGASCSGAGFPNAGSHYNPWDVPHPHHAGDLPPVLRLSCGCGWLAVRTDRFCLKDILGKVIILHSGADDFRTQPGGAAGAMLACGEIVK